MNDEIIIEKKPLEDNILMVDYIVFDPFTGDIKRTGCCLKKIVYLQIVDMECVIIGKADATKDKIDINNLEIIKNCVDKEDITQKITEEMIINQIIERKKEEILRKMAISELEKEGVLDKECKLIKNSP